MDKFLICFIVSFWSPQSVFSFSATNVYGFIIDQFQSRQILFGYSFNCFFFFCFFVIYSLQLFIYSLNIDVLPKTSFSPFWHRLGPL